jgi:site-specific DNA-methyltransferase (adenine-specific)
MARKPLIGTVAANVLLYGTGGINVDACRVGTDGGTRLENMTAGNDGRNLYGKGVNAGAFSDVVAVLGRWPANLIHDGSDEVLALFPESGSGKASERGSGKGKTETFGIYGGESTIRGHDDNGGSAARFFYTAKADSSERRQSKHPTVKPLDLIRYLVRMVTPIGGVVLDPFLGSGTLCEAARAEHCRSIGIELDEAYCADAVERLRQGVLF